MEEVPNHYERRHRPRKRRRLPQDAALFCWINSFIIQQKANADGNEGGDTTSTTSTSSSAMTTSTTTTTTTTSTKGHLTFRSICARDWVKVTSMVLTCDSPGAYYYGSSTYRNSETCAAGDKANLGLEFTITNQFATGNSILVTIESGLLNQFVTVVDTANLCQLGLKGNNAYRCPKPGDYQLQTYYYVPKLIPEASFHYTPDLTITFFDNSNINNATTNAMTGSSSSSTAATARLQLGCDTSGAYALHQSADEKAARGMAALGIALATFVSVFGLLLLWTYWSNKHVVTHHTHNRPEVEERKVKAAAAAAEPSPELTTLRRYNNHHNTNYNSNNINNSGYFRTLPNGKVVHVPGLYSVPTPQLRSSSSSDLSRCASLCNPPAVPTRPVI